MADTRIVENRTMNHHVAFTVTGVAALHLALLGAVASLANPVAPQLPGQPVIQGVLVSAPLPAPEEKLMPVPAPQAVTEPEPVTPAKPEPTHATQTPHPITSKAKPAATPRVSPPAADTATATAAEIPVILPRMDARQHHNPAPLYPSRSRRLREQGTVVLDLLILPDGRVDDIRVITSSGYARLDEAAIQTVQQWRYVPAKRGAQAIAWRYRQAVVFSLSPAS